MQHTNNITQADDEYLIDLSKLWRVIRQSWRLIASVTFLCGALAIALTFFLPKKWEAVATLHVGRAPLSSNSLELIEQPSQTVERIKLRGFKEEVLLSMALPIEEDVDDRSDIVVDTLKGTATKGTEFVNLVVRGYSPQEAEAALKSTVDALQVEHALIAAPSKNRVAEELAEVTAKLVSTSVEFKNINEQMTASGTYKAGSEFAPSIVAINLLASKDAEMRTLRAQVIDLKAKLATFDEQSTKVINKIQATKRALYPKRSIFLASGLFFGLLLGVALALFRQSKSSTTTIVS